MAITGAILKRLAALNLSTEAFQEVLSILADMQSADDTRREEQRINKKNQRSRPRTVPGQSQDTPPLSPSPSFPPHPPKNPKPLSPPPSTLRSESSEWPDDFRERFWAAYPRKTGKGGALRKLDVVRRTGNVEFTVILASVARYAAEITDVQFIKHPETWLSKGCWDDYAATAPPRVDFTKPPEDYEQRRAAYLAQKAKETNGQDEGKGARNHAGVGKNGANITPQLQLSGGAALREPERETRGRPPDD